MLTEVGSKSLWMEMWLLKELQLWLRCHHTPGKGLSQRRGLGDGKELAGTSHLPDAPGQEMPSSLFPGSGQGRRISWSSCRNQCLVVGKDIGTLGTCHQWDTWFYFIFSLRKITYKRC